MDMIEFKRRLTDGFKRIRKRGYVARQNFSCCQSCGCAELPDGTEKYVFYHRQDTDRLKEDLSVYLAWDGDGGMIVNSFEEAGLRVNWDGSESRRIRVSA